MTDKQHCKVFVGGLNWETTDEKLRRYFENYGTVVEAFVSYDRVTMKPRGFGFVVFEDPAVADKVVKLQHTIDRREVRSGRYARDQRPMLHQRLSDAWSIAPNRDAMWRNGFTCNTKTG